MKKKLEKCSHIMQIIFGWGIMIAVFVGGISFFGYLVAFFIGGETATNICNFIYKNIYPILFYFTSIIVIIGLISMYLKGESALKTEKKKIKKQTNKNKIKNQNVESQSGLEPQIENNI